MRRFDAVARWALTSVRIGIRIVQLERHPLDKIAQVVRTSHHIRVRRRRSTAYGNRPPVCMVGTGERLPLLRSQDYRSVSIDDRTVYAQSLERVECKQRPRESEAYPDSDALGHGFGWRLSTRSLVLKPHPPFSYPTLAFSP